MSSAALHVVVAGAGVTGLACARLLSLAGAKVTIVDPSPGGENASGVAAGMIAPAFEATLDPLARGHLPLLREARDLWPALAADAHIPLHRTGAVARGRPEWRSAIAERMGQLGIGHEVRASEVFTPEDWLLDPMHGLLGLYVTGSEPAQRLHDEVAEVSEGHARLRSGERIRVDCLIAACGPAAGLAPEQAHLVPIKGHILTYPRLVAPGPILRGEEVYACAWPASTIVGASMEVGRADTAIDASVVANLRRAAAVLLPDAAAFKPKVQVGVRAGTPDGLPLVGPSATPGVILAAGLRRNGWLLAPLVAKVVAAYALGRDPGPHAAAFDPRRFDTSGQ